MYNNRMDRLQIVLEIVNNLKNFKTSTNTTINLYDDNRCHFIKELKEIFKNYIQQEECSLIDYKGVLYFQEIDKNIEYLLPCKKKDSSLFVIRGYKS